MDIHSDPKTVIVFYDTDQQPRTSWIKFIDEINIHTWTKLHLWFMANYSAEVTSSYTPSPMKRNIIFPSEEKKLEFILRYF